MDNINFREFTYNIIDLTIKFCNKKHNFKDYVCCSGFMGNESFVFYKNAEDAPLKTKTQTKTKSFSSAKPPSPSGGLPF